MNIRETTDFEIIKVETERDATKKIILRNSNSGIDFETIGGVLEAQFSADSNYLLFISEGNPFEEALYISFLDQNLKIQDFLELSADYTAGIFSNASIIESDSITFSFFGKEDSWKLTVLNNPKYFLQKNKYPVKRSLSVFRKGWLQLKKL